MTDEPQPGYSPPNAPQQGRPQTPGRVAQGNVPQGTGLPGRAPQMAAPQQYAQPVYDAPPTDPEYYNPPQYFIPAKDPHRRPARITVVAILMFIYGGLIGLCAPFVGVFEDMGKSMTSSMLSEPPPAQPHACFGFNAPLGLYIAFSLLVAGTAVLSGIFLLKRKQAGIWLLLGLCMALTLNELLSIPLMLEAAKAQLDWQERNSPSGKNLRPMMSSIANITVIVVLGAQIAIRAVLIWLVLSVARWFKGEAVFQNEIYPQPPAPQQYA